MALQYLTKAAQSGSSVAMVNLAYNYARGELGLAKDNNIAIMYARKALLNEDDGLYPNAARLAKQLLKNLGAN